MDNLKSTINRDNNLQIKCIRSEDSNFYNTCYFCEQNINRENLYVNGGTLKRSDLTYKCLMLIVVFKNQNTIAYTAIKEKIDGEYYISQIAVKKEYRGLGIGKAMITLAIQMSENDNKNLKAHVRYWNTPSLEMFRSLGFSQSEGLTKKGSYTFTLKQKILDHRSINTGKKL